MSALLRTLKSAFGVSGVRAEAKALVARGDELDAARRHAEALEAYRKAAELDPSLVEALRGRVKCAAMTGRTGEVIEAGRALLGRAPTGGRFYIWLAEAMLAERASSEDVAWLDRLAQKHASAVAFRALAELNLARGDQERAMAWLRRDVLSPDEPIPGPLYELVDAYIAALSDDARVGEQERRQRLLLHAGRIGADRAAATPALQVVTSPVRRERVASWIFLKRFAEADRGDLQRTRVFRPGGGDGDWLHPVYCGNANRLHPGGRGEDAYFVFDVIAEEILDELRSGRGFLALDCAQEGMFSNAGKADVRKLQGMVDYLSASGLPLERIILLDGNLTTPKWLADAGLGALRVVEDRYLWLDLAGVFRRLRREAGGADERLITTAKALEQGERRGKAFLSFNHAPRAHRSVLVAWMLEQGLLERGLVSFHGAGYLRDRKGEYDDEQWVERTLGQIAAFSPLIERPEPTVRRLLELSPLSVDVDLAGTGRTAKALAFGANDPWPYRDSYFSAVTDTVFSDGSTSHVTEKIIKPIANLHPFVYLGEPFALAELRLRGYQTFAPFIDEVYDEIADPLQRMQAALAEIERLARLPLEQLHEIYQALWPRMQHNYLNLLDGAPQEAERIALRIRAAMDI